VENVFVSDLVTDYLFLYANADVVRSDRIHACLPALTYGNRAQFYFDTPRANLFDRVPIDGDATSEPVRFDMDDLEREKDAQVDALEGESQRSCERSRDRDSTPSGGRFHCRE